MKIYTSEYPLHFAAENGNLDDIQKLLAAGNKVNARDKWNVTPLMVASENGHVEIVTRLIAAGADVNAKSRPRADVAGRQSALHLAVEANHSNVVSLLLEVGADPNAIDGYKCPPLSHAVAIPSIEITRMLLDAGAKADGSDEDKSGGPLSLAAYVGPVEIVKMLLARGANPNRVDWRGSCPLHGTFKLEIAVELIRAGADINARGEDGRTPMMSLNLAGSVDLLRFYIESGADVNVKADEGITPLMNLAHIPRLDFMTVLCDAGASVNARDNFGNSVLDYFSKQYGAVRKNEKEKALDFLIRRGATQGNNFSPKSKSRKR